MISGDAEYAVAGGEFPQRPQFPVPHRDPPIDEIPDEGDQIRFERIGPVHDLPDAAATGHTAGVKICQYGDCQPLRFRRQAGDGNGTLPHDGQLRAAEDADARQDRRQCQKDQIHRIARDAEALRNSPPLHRQNEQYRPPRQIGGDQQKEEKKQHRKKPRRRQQHRRRQLRSKEHRSADQMKQLKLECRQKQQNRERPLPPPAGPQRKNAAPKHISSQNYSEKKHFIVPVS